MRGSTVALFLLLSCCLIAARASAQAAVSPAASAERSGAEVYRAACVSCHGPDGKGQPEAVLGFAPPDSFPDFTECPVASVEPDDLWRAVITRGGRVRGLSHIMPAFGDVLTPAEIDRVIEYLHAFCAEPDWPRGNMNFPRPFFTTKAFPENEYVFTVGMVPSHPREIEPSVEYEHRLGRRAQYEISAPFSFEQTPDGHWNRGLHEFSLGYKYAFHDSVARGSIASAGAEVTINTEREVGETPHRASAVEGFVLFGQALPRDAFVQLQAGVERPFDRNLEPASVFWRGAVGKMIKQRRWGRLWTPMVELLGARELEDTARVQWDIVPQMQVSLSIFQHIRMNVGARVPLTDRGTRRTSVMAYLMWDWFDGGLFELWRAQ